jgi:hypothetical protein
MDTDTAINNKPSRPFSAKKINHIVQLLLEVELKVDRIDLLLHNV